LTWRLDSHVLAISMLVDPEVGQPRSGNLNVG